MWKVFLNGSMSLDISAFSTADPPTVRIYFLCASFPKRSIAFAMGLSPVSTSWTKQELSVVCLERIMHEHHSKGRERRSEFG